MRLGKLLSAGEITEAAEVAGVPGQEPAGEPEPPVPAAPLSRDAHGETPAPAQPVR